MNYLFHFFIELMMVLTIIAASIVAVCRVSWVFWYYVVAARNPIGKTALTSAAALWILWAGILAII